MDCLARSAAYVINIDYNHFISVLGHDGSELVDYNTLHPFRGFTTQEIVRTLLKFGYACIDIERELWRHTSYNHILLANEDAVSPHLHEPMYILYGGTHAIGVRSGRVFDTLGQTNSPVDFKYSGMLLIKPLINTHY